jgi:RNA polymerase sigma-70 factor (ECF subfamily)
MIESAAIPLRVMPSGLCEDTTGEATALIGRMAKGDGAALDELHRSWAPMLQGIANRVLGDPAEAESAVQETFARLWRQSPEYDPHEWKPFTWAFVTLRTVCNERLHRRRRKKPQSTPDEAAAPQHETIPLPGVMTAADSQRILTALNHLDAEERSHLEHAVFLEYLHPANLDPDGPSLGSIRLRLRSSLDKICHQLSRYEL